jgi:hypothetical protein
MYKNLILILFSFTVPISSFAQNIIGGIGAQLFMDTTGGHTMPRILSLVPGAPAYDSLKATDFIMSVNGNNCRDKNLEEIVGWIRGVAGTTVTITVADTKEGARPRTYDLKRVSIQMPDPVTPFNERCNNEVAQLKKKGFEIVKTYTSDGGNYFFNFNAEAGGYRVRVYTLEDKNGSNNAPGFQATAKVSDPDNEASAVTLSKSPAPFTDNSAIAQQDGSVTFKRDCVGVVSTNIQGDAKKCLAMYIVVYR